MFSIFNILSAGMGLIILSLVVFALTKVLSGRSNDAPKSKVRPEKKSAKEPVINETDKEWENPLIL